MLGRIVRKKYHVIGHYLQARNVMFRTCCCEIGMFKTFCEGKTNDERELSTFAG